MIKRGGGGGGRGTKFTAFHFLLFQHPFPFVDFVSSMSSRFFDCKILFRPFLYFPKPLHPDLIMPKKKKIRKIIIECKICIKGTFS